jgi:small GTP-binding protein
VRKFVLDEFDDKYITTIGLKVTKKSVTLPYGKESVELIMMLWDILGQKGFQRTHERAFRGVDGAICVADVTRTETLKSLEEYWIPNIIRATGPIPIIFFANKVDLEDQVQFGMRELLSLEERYKMKDATGSFPQSFLTSARTGAGVEEGFKSMGYYLLFTEPSVRDDKIVIMNHEEFSFESPTEALDAITVDFINRFFYEIAASTAIQESAAKVEFDITNPTANGLRALVEELASVEKRAGRPDVLVTKNLERRRKMIDSIPKMDTIK